MSDSKEIVCDFLKRCVLYADSSINRKRERDEDVEEIKRWLAYRDFTAYALSEVERGELDDWFKTDGEDERKQANFLGLPMTGEIRNIDIDYLEHADRASWLSTLIAPRPLMLLATTSEEGVENLCPVSSASLLSNHPPLIGVSLSQNREGRPRDTLVNLRNESKVTVMILPGTWDAALLVDRTATPLAPDVSEWDGLGTAINSENGWPPRHSLAVATLECEVAEIVPLPDAVANLAILRVRNLIHPELGMKGDGPPDPETWRPLLAQFGLDRLTSGPDGTAWSFEVRSHRE